MLDLVGDDLVVDREHRRRRRGPRRARLAGPRPRDASGSPTAIDERGWGLDGDTFHVMDALRELGAPDTWFALGDRDLAWCLERARRLADGETPTAGARGARRARSGSRARVLPMCDEPVRTRVLARGALARPAGVPDPRARRGPRRGRRVRRHRRGAADRRGARGDRRRARDRDRAVEPDHLDRPDPRRCRACARRSPPRPRRSSRSPRSSAARCSRARRPRSWRTPGCPLGAAGIARAYAGVVDGLLADEDAGVDGIRSRSPTR